MKMIENTGLPHKSVWGLDGLRVHSMNLLRINNPILLKIFQSIEKEGNREREQDGRGVGDTLTLSHKHNKKSISTE